MAITLTGKQQEVLALPAKGHIVVLGTAGSGKTTIALHRARHLANIPGSGRILLVTFNRALVEYMKGIVDCLMEGRLTQAEIAKQFKVQEPVVEQLSNYIISE